ncbi:TPA: carotenoid oxygenase family protein [Stenotrophomonas maltophilia]|nr:carotenoid oxygenase family protein [Stenotrophomonas maltophilia]HDS1043586.1 carotenoid oxygenase family protein [Stenotrophomonas maltophilia]
MDRRRFLRTLISSTAGLALGATALRSAPAFANDPAQFAQGLQAHPWLMGWRGVSSETLGPATVQLQGRLPAGLAGTLYRNGPAWSERGNLRYDHWFDGDGMVHGWHFNGDGSLTHRARMVATPKFTREQKAGRFLYPAAGTSVPNAQAVRNNDDANVANTSVISLNGRLFALCESGSAFEVHPDSLETIGPVTWRPDLAALPFSAHPLVDRDGSIWNFGSISLMGGAGLLVWHIGKDGQLISADVIATPGRGYLHAFSMTDQHLVFVLAPFDFNESGGSFFERMQFAPQRAANIAVVSKDAPDKAQWLEAPFAAIYHFGDAYRTRDGIALRAVRRDNMDEARSPMKEAMAGDGAHATNGHSSLVELQLDLRRGKARWQDTGISTVEFPLFDPRTPDRRAARLYAPTVEGAASTPYFNAVAAFDVERGRRQVWRYGSDIMAEEHVFVPRPGSRNPDDGWLVGTLLDPVNKRSGIAVLDARHVQDGPLAQAWLPYAVPLGFHGTFAAQG